MERYNRIVIDLFKDLLTDKHQVNSDRILEVQKILAQAITSARVLGTPVHELEALKNDVEYIKYNVL